MRRRFPNEALALGAIGLTCAFVGSGAWAQDRKGIFGHHGMIVAQAAIAS